jgi:hypothetical protein
LRNAKFLLLLPLMLALPLPASATLGGDAGSTRADQVRMKAALRVTPGAKYTVHEMSLPSGTTVREFVSPQGLVFAVAWEGPFKPDLQTLLGSYFDRYVQMPVAFRGGHNAAVMAQPDLVVRSMGHMRAFSGHAYLPAQLPADVPVDELR